MSAWWEGNPRKNDLNYWDAGAWKPLAAPAGLVGPPGLTGIPGPRASCGGCAFVGKQDAQPDSSMWSVDRLALDPTYAIDSNPCIQVFDQYTLEVIRAGSFVIGASIYMYGKSPSGGSSITMQVNQGSGLVDFARAPIPRGSDRGTATSVAAFNSGDKLRFAVWLVTNGTPTKFDLNIIAARMP